MRIDRDNLLQILKDPPRTPVILLTGNVDEGSPVHGAERGAQDYLVTGWIGLKDLRRSVRDARERDLHRATKSALHVSEERLRAFAQNAPVILFAMDLEGRLTLLEGKPLAELQLGPTRGIGALASDLFGMDAVRFQRAFGKVLAGTAGTRRFALRGRVFEAHYGAERDADGEVRGVIGVATDVTEQVQATDRFAKAFDQSPVAMVISSAADGLIIDANEAYARAVGYAREELLGHTSLELRLWVSPEDRPTYLERILKDPSSAEFPLTLRRKDEALRSFMVSARPIALAEVPCILTTLRDVTEAKELQRRLVESERFASTGQFAGFIAHQLNTPLTNIALLTDSVQKRVTDPLLREKLEKIHDQRRTAANILADLLSFARQRDLRPSEVDLRETVEMACAQIEPFRKPAVGLLRDVPVEPVSVRLDAPKIQEALGNLIKNAFEATEAGHVTVALRREGNRVALSVTDTGSGIDPEALPHLFEPFYTTKRGSLGTGLGLVLCKTIVEAHGGRIEVVTEPGKGSTFTLHLPAEIPPS